MKERIPAVVALGMFDGVHLGHRALIGQTVAEASRLGAKPVVFTFFNHPMEVLGGGVRLLSSIPERDDLLRALGAEEVYSVAFTRELAALSAEQFIDLLLERWDVRALVAGYNYTCGARGSGTPETLAEIGKTRGFSVLVVSPVLLEGASVSSTRVREALEQGDVELARRMLKRRYTLAGTVIENRRIGRRIGFPTANIAPEANRVIPKDGVYATIACVNGADYRAVTNIGTNPTVHGDHLTIETHMIDFDQDIYGERLTVAFRRYLRGELMFSNLDELKDQIRRDISQATER
jgi:riboflavin kinase/FMN adenylyltransferase